MIAVRQFWSNFRNDVIKFHRVYLSISQTPTVTALHSITRSSFYNGSPQVVNTSSCAIYHHLALSNGALESWKHILCRITNKTCQIRKFIPDLRPQLSRIVAIWYCARYLVLYQRYDETHNTICFRMSFPLNFISGLDTSDHEPIQKRTGSRYLI